jgi:anti-anti-sigma factor
VRGEIDLATAERLGQQLDELPPDAASWSTWAMCHSSTQWDSMGLSVLIRQSMRLREGGGSLHIRRPGPNLRRLLVFCCLDHLITSVSDGEMNGSEIRQAEG